MAKVRSSPVQRQIVALSGSICSGKSSLAAQLAEQFGFVHFRSTQAMLARCPPPAAPVARAELQRLGQKMDEETAGKWIASALAHETVKTDVASFVVDSVRTKRQVDELRRAFGYGVVHLHLQTDKTTLKQRFKERSRLDVNDANTFEEAVDDDTEKAVNALADVADVRVDTAACSITDVVVRTAAHLDLFNSASAPTVDVLIGGQWGSEGKGHVAAYLAPEYDVLVRVGGPNAGHTVYEEPEPFVFHHLPSGSRRNHVAQLVIGPGAVLSVPKLIAEITRAEISQQRLTIDPQAMTIAPQDEKSEAALRKSIGSTAQGVGFATARKVLRSSAEPQVVLAKDVPDLAPYLRETHSLLEEAFRRGDRILLEGTQGTGLSIHHGSYPYVTSRDTTVSGCLAEAGIAPHRVRRVVLVCRSYPIRVESPKGSTSGPMGTEISFAELARRCGQSVEQLRDAERTSTTRCLRRIAEFNWTLLRKAAALNGPTDVALTFADYLSAENVKARRFEQLEAATLAFVEEIERVTGARVSLITTRFHYRSIIDRRQW